MVPLSPSRVHRNKKARSFQRKLVIVPVDVPAPKKIAIQPAPEMALSQNGYGPVLTHGRVPKSARMK